MVTTFIHAAEDSSPSPRAEDSLRLGFSFTMFSGINEADARASIRALASTIARENKIDADPDPVVTTTVEQAASAMRTGRIDAIGLTMEEYRVLRDRVAFDRFLLSTYDGDPAETYLLLVHAQSQLRTLADLKGRKLLAHSGARMSLALPWLEVELARHGLPPSAEFLGVLTSSTKAPQAILPVFFRQADACLVNRRAYDTVVELNPQIGRDLRALAASPPYIPALFAFRADWSPELKEKSIRVFAQLHRTLYGQQTLLIFQSSQVQEFPASSFASAQSLLDEYTAHRAKKQHPAAPIAPAEAAPR